MPGRCWRCGRRWRRGPSLAVRSSFTSPTTKRRGGCAGPKELLDRGLTKPDAVISAGFSYSVVTAHNGCLHVEVTVTGRQAHAAMPDSGVDALEAVNVILTALYRHRAALAGRRSATPGIVAPTL